MERVHKGYDFNSIVVERRRERWKAVPVPVKVAGENKSAKKSQKDKKKGKKNAGK